MSERGTRREMRAKIETRRWPGRVIYGVLRTIKLNQPSDADRAVPFGIH